MKETMANVLMALRHLLLHFP